MELITPNRESREHRLDDPHPPIERVKPREHHTTHSPVEPQVEIIKMNYSEELEEERVDSFAWKATFTHYEQPRPTTQNMKTCLKLTFETIEHGFRLLQRGIENKDMTPAQQEVIITELAGLSGRVIEILEAIDEGKEDGLGITTLAIESVTTDDYLRYTNPEDYPAEDEE